MSKNDGHVVVEDARIVFRNFAGKEGRFNREGDRNFAVILDEDVAAQLKRDGWNVKTMKPREEGDEETPYLEVKVNYKGRPPHIVMLSHSGRSNLGEAEVDLLDWVDIEKVDLIFRPYVWDIGGKTGITAYLKSMFITIEEDELQVKYAQKSEGI